MTEPRRASSGCLILVIDDSPVKRFATASAIRAYGYDVIEADSGKDGLWLAGARHPSLIVLDVNLPDIHGFEVVRQLKERPLTAAIPVLHLSTTRMETSDRTRGLDGGADAYLTGLIEPSELMATINALLRAKRSEERARKLAAEWQTTFDALTDGVCVVDERGVAQRCNRAMARLFGLHVEDVVGESYRELLTTLLKVRIAPADPAPPAERRTLELQGEGGWYVQTTDPIIGADGAWLGEVQTLRDTTERKRELEELKEAKRLAEEASRTKSAFLANMSHEIRSPLASILGYSELLHDEALTPDERGQFLATIARNGQQLIMLIDDILDLSKVEAGRLDIELVEVETAPLLAEVHESLAWRAKEKSIDLRLRLAPDVPPVIVTDPMRLRQILVNIVGNALKFTEHGRVDVAVTAAGARLEVLVTDTGAGVPPEKRDKLFRPFSQADSSTTRRFGGTGLGLALSRNLAQALAGDLQLVSSEPGVGSTFLITIAMHLDQVKKGLSAAAGPAGGTPLPSLAGVRVLVADDAYDNRVLIKRFLSRAGAEVRLVEDGREAVRAASEQPYDVVIMDMQMPNTDGYTATRELRSDGYTRPIIALTAHAMREERDKSLWAGCNDHLTKPFNAQLLVRKVAHYAAAGAAASPHHA